MALVRIGKVVRALGLDGRLGVAGPAGEPSLRRLFLQMPSGERAEDKAVLEARRQGRLWAVKVEGVGDRTAAERWVGAEVLAERQDLGEPAEGSYYWADLEGLEVATVAGEAVGQVVGLYATGGVDVLVVKGARGEKLVPLAPYVRVDRAAGRVVVDPPKGLLDDDQG
jgi:16S rRNA processing protein RimM